MLNIKVKDEEMNVARIGFPARKFRFVMDECVQAFASDVYFVSDLFQWKNLEKKEKNDGYLEEADSKKKEYLEEGRLSMLQWFYPTEEKITDTDVLVRLVAMGLDWLKGYGLKEFSEYYKVLKKAVVGCHFDLQNLRTEERNSLKRECEEFLTNVLRDSKYGKWNLSVKLRGKDFDNYLNELVKGDKEKVDGVQYGKYKCLPEKQALIRLAYYFLMSFGYSRDETDFSRFSLFDPDYFEPDTEDTEDTEEDEDTEDTEDTEEDEDTEDTEDTEEEDEYEETEVDNNEDSNEEMRSGLGRDVESGIEPDIN